MVVFVVGQWLRFHQGDQAHQVADHAPGFAACQFGYVRVFFLRHDGRAGGEAVSNLYEAEVLAHPDDEFFAQSTDVQHAQRGRRRELDGEIAVADRVQTVLTDLRRAVRVHHAQRAGHAFAVQRIRGACQRRRAQWQAVGACTHFQQTFLVTRKHFHISQQMVSKAHRLRDLQMREAGHDGLRVMRGHFNQRKLQIAE